MRGSTRCFGKCILLGEHSVVRGQPAVVLPLSSRSLSLTWENRGGADGVEADAGDFAPAFRAALAEALRLANVTLPAGTWHFTLSSDIPARAGMGSSAALSVAIARFFAELGFLGGDLFPFALSLENLFHGKSSGIDVAAVLHGQPIRFQAGVATPLPMAWRPHLFLSDTGLRSSTKACVEKVIALNRPDLDERHGRAADLGIRALAAPYGQELLVEAMNEGLSCFREWDLVPALVEAQIEGLRKAGALAVKPTGSGNGGYLLSLWPEAPSLGLISVL